MAYSDPWFVCYQPEPRADRRLFCFPYAGGDAAIYRAWPDGLPGVEVVAVRPPGRGSRFREPSFTRIAPLVSALAGAVQPLLDRPFAFFGHSLGALIAFELTRELRRRNDQLPLQLIVSGSDAPQRRLTDKPVHALPDAEFIENLRQLDRTPSEVLANQELISLLLPMLRADFAVLETYDYVEEPPLGCPILVVGGQQDERVRPDSLQGWADQTSEGFSLEMLPGGHFFLNASQALLLQVISNKLPLIRGA